MDMEEIADLLIFAALGGDKPVEVSCSAWLDACERVWKDSRNELLNARERLETAKLQLDDAVKTEAFKKQQYEAAKASNK